MNFRKSYICREFITLIRKFQHIGILLFCLAFISVNAQEFGSNAINAPLEKETIVQNSQGFKPDVRVSLGTSFSTFGPGFNAFGTYIAPEISFPVYKKFSVSVGLGYSSMFYGHQGESMFGSNPSQYGSIYVSGTYQVNEKLTIRGTGYKTFLLNPNNFNEDGNANYYDFSNQGIRLDMDYKVSDEFRIGISFEYREQNYPGFNYHDPGGFNNFGSPFRTPGFGPSF